MYIFAFAFTRLIRTFHNNHPVTVSLDRPTSDSVQSNAAMWERSGPGRGTSLLPGFVERYPLDNLYHYIEEKGAVSRKHPLPDAYYPHVDNHFSPPTHYPDRKSVV